MLQVKNLIKKFGPLKAVDDISFQVKKGEIVGFLGPNGAGKTTTMRMISGFLTPNQGEITINNLSPKEARPLIGYLAEENPLYSQLTPLEYLNFIGQVQGLEKEKLNSRIDSVLESCGLKEVFSKTIETLSRGFRQRVGLAAVLVHDPKLLIMDEPTSGLDPNQQEEMRKLIQNLARDKGVIFSTHILSEAKAICQKIIIIHQGKIVLEEEMKNLKKKRQSLEKLFSQLTK